MTGRSHRQAKVLAPPPLICFVGLVAGVFLDRVYALHLPPVGGLDLVGAGAPLAARLAIGVPLFAAGYALNAWAVRAFREARTTILPQGRPSALVSVGPYRISRNPMYVGMAVGYVALSILVGSVWALVLLPLVLGLLTYGVILREERVLAGEFGASYATYRASVRRWL